MQRRMPMARRHQQTSFFKSGPREHGGSLAVGKRRAKRTMGTKNSLHVTVKSTLAVGPRALTKHKEAILAFRDKYAKKFGVRIYESAVVSNHLHFLIIGRTREGLQNFFRVFPGQIAQYILELEPLTEEQKAQRLAEQPGCRKNKRTFWSFLLYSRIVAWGQDFKNVKNYIRQNMLEALGEVAYKVRAWQKKADGKAKKKTQQG